MHHETLSERRFCSAATFTGNPQNMILGVSSHLDYADFAGKLAPAAAVALALTAGFILLFYREEFSTAFGLSAKEPRPRQHSRQLAKGMLVTLGVIVGFLPAFQSLKQRSSAARCFFCHAP